MLMFRRTRGGLALTVAISLTLLALIVGIGVLAYNARTVFADGNPHPAAPTATPVPPTPTTAIVSTRRPHDFQPSFRSGELAFAANLRCPMPAPKPAHALQEPHSRRQ